QGNGNDTILLSQRNSDPSSAGTFAVDGGAGDDNVTLAGIEAHRVVVLGRTGNDEILLRTSLIGSTSIKAQAGVEIQGGDGHDVITFTGGGSGLSENDVTGKLIISG